MAWGRSRAAVGDAGRELATRIRPGERVLVATRTPDGEAVGGTERAFYLPGDVVLGWHEIDQARWDVDERRFDVVTLPIDGPAHAYQVVLDPPGRMPELVRERVTSTVVVSQHVPVSGRRGFRIVARRVPDDNELAWIAVYDAGVDAESVEVREHVSRAVQVLRTNLGV